MEVGGIKKETFKKEGDDFFFRGVCSFGRREEDPAGRGTLQIFKKWREREESEEELRESILGGGNN